MLDFSRFEYLSFDCYGTLIDWETGILGFFRPLLRSRGCVISDDEILNAYSEFEPRQQSGRYRSYREVLASVVDDFARKLHVEVSPPESASLAESIQDWEPFADSVAALQRLQSRYKLVILSNIDDDLFAYTAPKLRVPLQETVTAQQAGSYKPSLRNFELLLERLAVPAGGLLHVAESLYHDVVPAGSLGVATVWVNRRQGRAAAATRRLRQNPIWK